MTWMTENQTDKKKHEAKMRENLLMVDCLLHADYGTWSREDTILPPCGSKAALNFISY